MRNYIKYISCFFLLFLLISSCYKETLINVTPNFEIIFINEDKSVPVKINIINKTEGADTYEWSFEGATIPSYTKENPGIITYKKSGNYTLKLIAENIDGASSFIEKDITLFEEIGIQFSTEIIKNNYPPVTVKINNETTGNNLNYLWTFEGGIPENSTNKIPENVVFKEEGIHTITLEVSNGFESFTKKQKVEVLPEIAIDFDWEVAFFDDDYQAPVSIVLNNKTTNAISYEWTLEGGIPNISTEENPKVTFNNVGSYTLSLKAFNGKETRELTKVINVLPNRNLRIFKDVELGINNAHNSNTIGAFFSSELRKTLKANEVNTTNGNKIDFAFFGLNKNFQFNKFISPSEAAINGFIAIPNAIKTKIINTQENCMCGINFNESQFDSMNNDAPLQLITIKETPNGLLHFNNDKKPRLVFFQTEEGRKGVVKIKQFVDNANDSYIVCDIKIQKLP